MTTLIIVCAWCGKYLGEKDGDGQTGITHGICPECAEENFPADPEPANSGSTN